VFLVLAVVEACVAHHTGGVHTALLAEVGGLVVGKDVSAHPGWSRLSAQLLEESWMERVEGGWVNNE
jgi:hypothetical protein